MAQDSEYAEKIHRKKDEQNKDRTTWRKAEREALIERARTDPEAAADQDPDAPDARLRSSLPWAPCMNRWHR